MVPEIIATSFNPWLVLLSYAIAAVGSFTALTAAGAAQRARGGAKRINVGLSGLALGGVAIWSMHFVGMVAWQLDLQVGYRWLETVVSLAAAVIVSTLVLGYVAAGPLTLRRLLVAGPLAGIGVAVMHYLGMYAMRFGGRFEWNFEIVAISVVIAMVAATAALWLAFSTRTRAHRIAAAFVMAAAVCSMHYTGMYAASVICTTRDAGAMLAGLMRPSELPAIVAVVAVGIAMMIGLDLLLQRVNAAITPAYTR